MHSLSLLVPVSNESALIEEFLEQTLRDLSDGGLDWELILINDGSTDDSLEKMQRWAQNEPRIRIVNLGTNHGPGANVYRAFAIAEKEHLTFATVDRFYDTRVLPHLMEHLDQYSVVSAYRTELTAHPPLRRLQTLTNNLVMRLLFPHRRFTAYHTLQIHRVDFIQAIRLEAVTPFMCSEMLFKAHALGLKIKEVGIEYLPRKKGKATGGSPKLIFRHVSEMMKFWVRWVVLREPIVDRSISLPQTASQRAPIGEAALANG
jgi:glycosyltransferase involved in cell wall biosynthesis